MSRPAKHVYLDAIVDNYEQRVRLEQEMESLENYVRQLHHHGDVLARAIGALNELIDNLDSPTTKTTKVRKAQYAAFMHVQRWDKVRRG